MRKDELRLDLDRIVFIGRTYEEYMQMFNLSKEDLVGKKILDCPAGACSFTAIANQLGANVTAADIAYYHPFEELAVKGLEDVQHAMKSMEKAASNYKWEFFKSIEGLRNHRMQALTDCSKDMEEFPDRYVPAALPVLPFEDQSFDMTLSAHFLFMYADRLDYDFHVKTIQELLRVTKDELRIFPLVDLANNRYKHLGQLVEFINCQGWITEETSVPYEFQKGANRMLVVKR